MFLYFLLSLVVYFVSLVLLAPVFLRYPPWVRSLHRTLGLFLWLGTIVSGLVALFS